MSPAMDPVGVTAAGNVRLWWVPTLSNPAVPTATEINAGTELSLALYDFIPAMSQARGSYQLLCSTQVQEGLLQAQYTISDIEYDYDPQLIASAGYPYAALTVGALGYIVERRGLPVATALVATQVVDVYPAQLGRRVRIPVDPSTDGEKLRVRQPVAVRAEVILDVVVVS